MQRLLVLLIVMVSALIFISCGDSGPTQPAVSPASNTGTSATNGARVANEASLRDAAVKGDAQAVKLLLDRGADVNAKDSDGRTALTEAAFYGHAEVVKVLLAGGADIFAKKNDGQTVTAMAAGHKDIAEMIDREMRLLEIAGKGDNKTLKEYLDKGVYVNVKDPAGRTPLIEATWYNHPETVKLLLDKGADPNAKKTDGVTPLAIAAGKGYNDIADMLRKAGAK